MNFEMPSIELVETEDGEPYGLQNSTSFIIDDGICIEQEDLSNTLEFPSTEKRNPYKLANSIQEFEELLRQHEIEYYTKYTIYKTNGPFKGTTNEPLQKPRIHWGALAKVSPHLATTPYLIIGTRYYMCHLGKCNYTSKLRGCSVQKDQGTKRRYKKVTDSKKVGCPAGFKVQRLVLFSDNKLREDTPSGRARMGDFIRHNISSVRVQHGYLFKFPDFCDHRNHMQKQVAACKEPIDKRVVDKIREQVFKGQTNPLVVTEVVEEFVEKQIQVRDRSRRRFYPSRVDIQRNIHKAKLSLRKCRNDLQKVEATIASLGDASEVLFQPCLEAPASDSQWSLSRRFGLLFVFQSHEMRRLYRLYGQHCLVLDPTYRYLQCAFPLYFVVVQTNVNFQVVGVIITDSETKEAVSEALSVLTNWSPLVLPKYALTDNSYHHIKALETSFPETKVFIASYYCRVAWEFRLSRNDMRHLNRSEALGKLNQISKALTEDRLQRAINDLKAWPQPLFKEYFEKGWQKEIKRWTMAYRPLDSLFEANDSIERLDEELRYLTLSKLKDLQLSDIIYEVCVCLLPETLQHYRSLNENILNRPTGLFPSCVPPYLQNSPQWFVDLILERSLQADQSLSHCSVEYLSEGEYSVSSKKSNTKYVVKFNREQKKVSCTCFHFLLNRVICKHALIIGRFYPMLHIEKVSAWLFDYPTFVLDRFLSSPLNFIKKEPPSNVEVKVHNDADEENRSRLLELCRNSLRSLGGLSLCMSCPQLEVLHEKLQQLRSHWTTAVEDSTPGNSFPSIKEGEQDDIPVPFLKKISDFYANETERKTWKNLRIERGRKRKKYSSRARRMKHARKKSEQIEIERKGSSGGFSANARTGTDGKSDVTVPSCHVKLEAEESNDLSAEIENSHAFEEFVDEKKDVVVHIISQENRLGNDAPSEAPVLT